MEIVISIAAKIAEYTVAPVGQWLCYSCHYSKNMESLKNQEKKLQNAKDRWEQSVDDALRKGEEIHSDVNKWLTEASRILRECEEKAEARSSHATCVNLKQRHRLTREANKIAGNIVKHLENGNFNPVSYLPAAQDRMVTTRHKNYVTLESRTSVANEVMEALGDANIKKIGVWGMPGVGKSTLMKEIERRAKEENLFHGVVLAAVTERPELSRIRGEIAVMLNQERHRQQTEIGRANLQQESSTKDAKSLVILDDIWPKQLELEDIGIPSEGCKVVLTSRNRDVLVREMGTQKNFELESLVEEEAWNLFEKMAGDSVKDPDVREVAIKVAKECAGLPVALTTVSKALKGKSLSIWKDAELRLKRPPPVDVPEILSPIYSCIELSYNQLADEEHKSLILLCALLDQYYGIYYRDLLKYCFGLGLFQGIVTLEEARHRLDSLVSDLQDSCLLLEGSNISWRFYFRMHDVVRYVAIIIGSKDRDMFTMRDNGGLKAWPDVDSLKRCQAFSIFGGDIDQLPNEMECPELKLFHVCLEDCSWQIPDTFFQGIDKLEVLDLTNMQLSSLPLSLLLLRNLHTLCLDGCVLGDISGIGELKNLVILSFLNSKISKLPREIGSLVRLRLLDLSNCSKLEMIPPNVISSLVKLEELYMGNSFVQWEFEGDLNDERKNANLAELKHLSNLTTLEIQIPDANNLPKDLAFEKLERYKIYIGHAWGRIDSADQSSRTLKLKLNSSFQSKFWIKMLLRRMENLHLDELDGVKSVIPEIDEEGFQQLMHLRIQNNGEIKHILNLRTPVIAFPTLETFVLENMISLEEICHGKLCLTSFKNLRVLKVISCEKLRYVFSSSIAGGIPLLEELEVKSCNNMCAIVVKEEEQGIKDGDRIWFRRLETLVLEDIPKLESFLSTEHSFMRDGREINHDPDRPLLHDQVAFPSLKSLIIKGLPKIKHVWSLKSFFPTSVISHMEQLRIICIEDCGVEEIVAGEGGREAIPRFVFPQVARLDLRNLHRLKWFYKGVNVSKWPMLKEMWIEECKKVKIFASRVVNFQETVEERQSGMSVKQPLFLVDEHSFPSLESLYIWSMDMLEIIWQDQVTASSFSNIQEFWIDSCQKLLHVFPSNLLTTTFIQSLSILRIEECSSLETIFEKLEAGQNGKESQSLIALKSRTTEESVMREDGGAARHFVLPTLTQVTLIRLPKLKWILEGEHTTLEWPSLKILRLWDICEQVVNMIFVIKECTFPNLELLSLMDFNRTIRPSDFPPSFLTGMPNLLEFKVYDSGWEEIFPYELLDPEVQVLTVPRLRRLVLARLPMLAHLWKEDTQPCPLFYNLEFLKVRKCNKLRILVPSSVFLQNLTDLDVSNCHGLINLVTSSTARTLLQLKKMTISKCKRITKIVAMEDGEPNVVITFNKLTYLELDGLPNLTNFCSGAYFFGFPSLEKLIVSCCPEMKTFCQGILSTPKLKGVQATKDDSH